MGALCACPTGEIPIFTIRHLRAHSSLFTTAFCRPLRLLFRRRQCILRSKKTTREMLSLSLVFLGTYLNSVASLQLSSQCKLEVPWRSVTFCDLFRLLLLLFFSECRCDPIRQAAQAVTCVDVNCGVTLPKLPPRTESQKPIVRITVRLC